MLLADYQRTLEAHGLKVGSLGFTNGQYHVYLVRQKQLVSYDRHAELNVAMLGALDLAAPSGSERESGEWTIVQLPRRKSHA